MSLPHYYDGTGASPKRISYEHDVGADQVSTDSAYLGFRCYENLDNPMIGHSVGYYGRWILPIVAGTCNWIIGDLASFGRTGPVAVRETEKSPRSEVLPETAETVRDLHSRSGLSWDELARLVGVSRRTIHNWANGATVSRANARRLTIAANIIKVADLGSPRLTRARLLAPRTGGDSQYELAVRSHGTTRISAELSLKPSELLGSATNERAEPKSGRRVEPE